jgi:TP901 family phage tail tape measure protein
MNDNESLILPQAKLDEAKSEGKQSKLSNDIQDWLLKNQKASMDAKQSLNEYYRELSSGRVSNDRLDYIRQELDDIDTAQRELGKLSKNLKDQFAEAYKSVTQWFSVSSVIMTLIHQLQRMPKEVYEIDTAMTNLYKVTDETEKNYTRFLDSAGKSAFNLGRSMSSLVEQTANWAKLGFSLDESAKLAEISSIYSNVGEVDDATAVSDIATAIKAFNIEASDAITIVDSLNKLGNEFATDAKSLGEGLRNAASSMAVAGNDINQTLAILTGGGEITQNVGELANSLRVASMRLRGMKDEIQSIGEEYEDIESISKIQTQIYNLTQGSVNILKDDGSFKSTYEQLEQISKIYFDLTGSDRADLTEIMFGKNRADQGVAILQAFQSGQIQKAYEASVNAAGSAMQEQEHWLGSLEAKVQQFEAAFQSLSSTVVDSDMLKTFVDLGTTGVSALDGVAKLLRDFNPFGGNIDSIFGTLGALSGLLMNKYDIGERTMFQW